MTIKHFLKTRIAEKKPILMDGGTGTEIMRRGVATKLPLWSANALMSDPQVVREIHRDYILSGAEIIITNTFRTQRRTLDKAKKGNKARQLTKLAVKLAKEAVKEARVPWKVWVAGSVAPLEDCYTPELVPDLKTAKKEHKEHIRNLLAGGVDFILVETMNTIGEAVVALEAAKELKVPLAVSFCVDKKGRILGGEAVADMVKAVEPLRPLALMINCSDSRVTTNALRELKQLTQIPIGAYANGMGRAHDDQGWIFKGGMSVARYLQQVQDWLKAGAILIGGCCGTTPKYIEAMRKKFIH